MPVVVFDRPSTVRRSARRLAGPLLMTALAACGARGSAPAAAGPEAHANPTLDPVAVAPAPAAPPVSAPPAAEPPVDDADADAIVIEAGTCPSHPGVHIASPPDSAEVRALVQDWLAERPSRVPAVVYRRGVVYVQSEEDRGDDPPYPSSAAAESERACGSHAQWLRAAVRERLRWRAAAGMVRCDGAVCCYDGMEYAPSGYVVFNPAAHDGGTVWALDAVVEIYEAALGEEEVTANRKYVAGALARLDRTRCVGEPAGLW